MIDCEHYKYYKGPNLKLAKVWKKKDEKLDITEEIVRLFNHLNYFLETMNSDISEGKKLAFICQEIGREVNTIGSKSNNAEMQQQVVQMKDELEKIKEQILNVL